MPPPVLSVNWEMLRDSGCQSFPDLSRYCQATLPKSTGLIRSGYRTITVAGAAGTGKSTLIREVVERTDGNVCVAAFTGQATRMLQNPGLRRQRFIVLIYRMQAGDAFKIEELRDRIDRLGNDPSVQKERKSLEENLQKLMVPLPLCA